MRALLRRRPPRGIGPAASWATCGSTPTPTRSRAASAPIELTQREFELLEYLMRNERHRRSRASGCSTRCGATTRSRSPTRSRCSSRTCEGSSKPMASLGSSIRSAARATSSAYRRLPIRWRLAGGSAVLTLVILMGFAAIVGVATTRRIRADFNSQVRSAADDLAGRIVVRTRLATRSASGPTSTSTAAPRTRRCAWSRCPGDTHLPDHGGAGPRVPAVEHRRRRQRLARRTSRPIVIPLFGQAVLQYGRRLSDVDRTIDKVRLFLDLRRARPAPRSRCSPAWRPRGARWRRSPS